MFNAFLVLEMPRAEQEILTITVRLIYLIFLNYVRGDYHLCSLSCFVLGHWVLTLWYWSFLFISHLDRMTLIQFLSFLYEKMHYIDFFIQTRPAIHLYILYFFSKLFSVICCRYFILNMLDSTKAVLVINCFYTE